MFLDYLSNYRSNLFFIDVQPYNSDDEDSGIVDNNLYKTLQDIRKVTAIDNPPFETPGATPEGDKMRETTVTESYISHSTFKPDAGSKKSSKTESSAKNTVPLIDNGAYLNGAFSPVDMDHTEMAVDCPVDFDGTPKTRTKFPSSDSREECGKPFNNSTRSRNEAIRYQQQEEIRRHEEEVCPSFLY